MSKNFSQNNSHDKKNLKNKNSHGRISLINAEGSWANTCNAVSPSEFPAAAKLELSSSICNATPALFYTKTKNSK